MLVSRHTARVSAVMGLVMLRSQASGQCSSMALPMPTSTGMLRSERLIPPGPDGVPHRLADAVARRHVEVDRHGAEAAGRDGHDDEVGPVERRRAGRWWWRSSPWRPGVVQLVGQRLHFGQRCRVDVLEHEVHAGERRRAEEVGHQLRSPLVAAAADDRHLSRHAATVQSRSWSASGVAPPAHWPPSSWAAASCTWSARSPSRRSCRVPSPSSTTPPHLRQRRGRARLRRRAGPAHPLGAPPPAWPPWPPCSRPTSRWRSMPGRDEHRPGDSRAVAWGRLPLQLVMAWAALQARPRSD